MKRLLVLLLLCASVLLLSAAPALACVTTVYSATFERGVIQSPWKAFNASNTVAQVVSGHAHSGSYAFEEAILPQVPSGWAAGGIKMNPPQNGTKYVFDGWLYVDSAYNWGMTTTPFLLDLTDGGMIGLQISSTVGGSYGYYALYTGSTNTGLIMKDVPQKTWHHLTVTYNRTAKTVDVVVDGQALASGLACDTSAAPADAQVYAGGGWAPGNGITSYIDDLSLSVTR